MLYKLLHFISQKKVKIIWVCSVCIFLVIVTTIIFLFDPKQLGTSVYSQQGQETLFNPQLVNTVQPNLFKVSHYITYSDTRLPFAFKYPSNWNLVVNYSSDRVNYYDKIILYPSTLDFSIYFESVYLPNPDSKEAKDFVQTSLSNPYSISLRDFVVEDFEEIQVGNKTLMISRTGGSDYVHNIQKQEVKQVATNLDKLIEYHIFEKRDNKITDSLSVVRGSSTNKMANTTYIKYEVTGIVPFVVWDMYEDIVKEIVWSIE